MDAPSLPSLLVKFKFDGNEKSEIAVLTYQQYSNLKELPITIECKIVKNQKRTLSHHDVELLDKKLTIIFAKSKPHVKTLSEE